MISLVIAVVLLLLTSGPLQSQGQCSIDRCPTSSPYKNVTTSSDDTFTYVSTSTCPPYANPQWRNPNSACDQGERYSIRKTPVYSRVPIPTGQRIGFYEGIHYLSDNPEPILGEIGVLVNGVVVYGPSAICGGNSVCPASDNSAPTRFVDAWEAEGRTLDQCGGHPSGQSRYHIHTGNTFNTSAGRRTCNLPEDTPGEHSVLLGWIFDGFPLYGQYSQGGRIPTQLDSCSGHTHMINGTMQYHYHIPMDFPWIIGCFKGCPVASNNMRQLNFNGNATYGCPQGLSVDPNPLYEDEVAVTTTPTATPNTTPSSATTLSAVTVLVVAVLCLSYFIA